MTKSRFSSQSVATVISILTALRICQINSSLLKASWVFYFTVIWEQSSNSSKISQFSHYYQFFEFEFFNATSHVSFQSSFFASKHESRSSSVLFTTDKINNDDQLSNTIETESLEEYLQSRSSFISLVSRFKLTKQDLEDAEDNFAKRVFSVFMSLMLQKSSVLCNDSESFLWNC